MPATRRALRDAGSELEVLRCIEEKRLLDHGCGKWVDQPAGCHKVRYSVTYPVRFLTDSCRLRQYWMNIVGQTSCSTAREDGGFRLRPDQRA